MGYQQLIVQLPTQTVCYDYSSSTLVTGSSVKQQLCDQYNLEASSLILANLGGRILLDNAQLFTTSNTEQLSVHLRLRGGKGGFGSLLRSQGGRMNSQKTTNFDACRDLQGRRLRDVEAQKREEEQAQNEGKRLIERREKFEKKIEKALKPRETPKHLFDDNDFLHDKEQAVDDVKNAVSSALKRPASASSSSVPAKKIKTTVAASVFDDELSSDDDEDDESESEAEQPPAKTKGKAAVKPVIRKSTAIKA